MPKLFYGLKDQEELDESIFEVLERHFDDVTVSQLPKSVTIFEHQHIPVEINNNADWLLERLLENLDENYGNPEEESPEIKCADRYVARFFVRQVASRYPLYRCEPTGRREEIQIRDWLLNQERSV